MTATAERIREYEMTYGTLSVEQFIDAVLAIQEHVDPTIVKPYQMPKETYVSSLKKRTSNISTTVQSPYDDIWSLDISKDTPANQDQPIRFPPQPEKDILWFIVSILQYRSLGSETS